MLHKLSALVSLLFALSATTSVTAHGTFIKVGANGGVGFGVTNTSPTAKNPDLFEQASRYIKGDTSPCGSQKLDGKVQTPINLAKELQVATGSGLASTDADGKLNMTLFQVNADGAGPYVCEFSSDATGKTFEPMTTVTDVPGTKGLSKAKNTPFPLVLQMPAGKTCTGPSDACLGRCKNGNSQPFGGCFAFKAGGGAAVAANKVRRLHEAIFYRDIGRDVNVTGAVVEEDPEDVDTDEVQPNPF